MQITRISFILPFSVQKEVKAWKPIPKCMYSYMGWKLEAEKWALERMCLFTGDFFFFKSHWKVEMDLQIHCLINNERVFKVVTLFLHMWGDSQREVQNVWNNTCEICLKQAKLQWNLLKMSSIMWDATSCCFQYKWMGNPKINYLPPCLIADIVSSCHGSSVIMHVFFQYYTIRWPRLSFFQLIMFL